MSHNTDSRTWRPRDIAVVAIAFALFAAALSWLVVDNREIFLDEPFFCSVSHFAFGLFRERASPRVWEELYDRRELVAGDELYPAFGKLYIGAFLVPVVHANEKVRYIWQWPLSLAENTRLGNIPPPRILLAARTAIATSALLALVAIYLATLSLGATRLVALLSPLALLILPNFEYHAKFVLLDMPQLAFALAGSVAICWFARQERPVWLVVGAALLGLSCAVKLSAATFVLGASLALLARPGWSGRQRFVTGSLLGVIAYCTFLLANPYFYSQPISRTLEMLRGWDAMKREQVRDPVLAKSAVRSDRQGVALLARNGLLRPELPLRRSARLWPSFQLQNMALVCLGIAALLMMSRFRVQLVLPGSWTRSMSAAALTAGTIDLWYFGSLGLYAIPIVLGLAFVVGRHREPDLRVWLWIWGVTFAVTAVWLPFDWPRYYLPLTALSIPLWCLGLVEAARWFALTPRKSNASVDSLTRAAD